MFASPYCKITKLSVEEPISGNLASAAFAGQPVQVVINGTGPNPALQNDLSGFRIADATLKGRIRILLRDVIVPDAFTQGNPLSDLVFGRPNTFENAVLVNNPVDAQAVLELEAEGGSDPTGAGQLQVETATVAGAITSGGAGNATVIVTAYGMNNSPKTLSVAVANSDSAATVAGKIRTALGADADVSAFFTVSGSSTAVVLTAITKAQNDTTMNISVDNGTCAGLTQALVSASTTPGLAVGDAGATFLKTSGTGAISTSTTADTNLTIVAGQWAVLTDNTTQYKFGRVIKQITPTDSAHVRIGIETCEPALLQ